MTATSDLLESQREVHSSFDTFMFKHVERLLQDKSQSVLVRQRASLLCSFTLDMIYQSFMDVDQRNSGLDLILNCLLDQIRSAASKSAKVLALQAIQTLTISVGDDAFGERI